MTTSGTPRKDFQVCSMCTRNCYKIHGPGEGDARPMHKPSFLIKLVESMKTSMMIPNVFLKTYGDTVQFVWLEGPSGQLWRVQVRPAEQQCKVALTLGWGQFVIDHGVEIGDQLVFSLNHISRFTVQIFDEAGCEKQNALRAINFGNHVTAPRPSVFIQKGKTTDKKGNHGGGTQLPTASNPREKRKERDEMETCCQEVKKNCFQLKPTGSSSVQGGGVEHLGCGILGKKEVDFHKVEELAKEELLLPPVRSSEKGLVSQRRPVTDLEKKTALDAASENALSLTNPNTMVVMSKSYVYNGFWLGLPKKFAREWMPSERAPITLIDDTGKNYPATFVINEAHAGISGGWRRFAIDHCLEDSDVCVFELIDKNNFTFRVHIFRVVEGIVGPPIKALKSAKDLPSRRQRAPKGEGGSAKFNLGKNRKGHMDLPPKHVIEKMVVTTTLQMFDLPQLSIPKGGKLKTCKSMEGTHGAAKVNTSTTKQKQEKKKQEAEAYAMDGSIETCTNDIVGARKPSVKDSGLQTKEDREEMAILSKETKITHDGLEQSKVSVPLNSETETTSEHCLS